MSFSIPDGPSNLVAQGGHVKEEPDGSYVWWANLINAVGYVAISENADGKLMYVKVGTTDYQARPISQRYNALTKILPDSAAGNFCLTSPYMEEVPENTTVDPLQCELMNTCKATVKVLVLLTPEAAAAMNFQAGSINSVLYLPVGLQSVNFALSNSGVYGKSFKYVVVPYNFAFSTSQLIQDDLNILENDATATALRISNKADLMVLLTNQRYSNAYGIWGEWATGPKPVGIVTIENMFGVRNIFAHELGHAFSLQHNRSSNRGDVPYDGEDVCAFRWRFFDGHSNERWTIMATISNANVALGKTQLLNYSNYEIPFDGAPTGTLINSNAFRLSKNMCQVADFFDEQELEVSIDGPEYVCNETVTYNATITSTPAAGQPGSGPYTNSSFMWWRSNTGFFNTANISQPNATFLGSGPSVQYTSTGDETFWLKLQVCGSGGVCANDVIKVTSCDGANSPGEDRSNAKIETTNEDFKLYPNPVKEELMIQLPEPNDHTVTFNIYNEIGQIVRTGAIEGSTTFHLATGVLPDGVYLCTIRNGDKTSAKQFFILH